ncbi:MAG: 7-cyano-7-deazaguanine synthase QueC [Gammaproteobacteria bacterium]|jgi:7-cyano-7-deazaguanine synthase
MTQRAVILLSGGLDSATTLAVAKSRGFECYALSFNYEQRHQCELEAAKKVALHVGVEDHKILHLDLAGITGSALTDRSVPVPRAPVEGIPVTYVPARNTVFLSLALGWAEVLGAFHIYIGVNAVDYSGYPDCRPEFIEAFEKTANLATKLGVEQQAFKVDTPLINLTKADIIRLGVSLGMDYGLTISCYDPDGSGRACGQCDSCRLRAVGFKEAGIDDPTIYQ